MTKDERDELARLAKKATPGERKWDGNGDPCDDGFGSDRLEYIGLDAGSVDVLSYAGCGSHCIAVRPDDRDYIAACSPEKIGALLREFAEMEIMVKALKETLTRRIKLGQHRIH